MGGVPRPYINLLIKPASSLCNMRCRYCFYADEAANRELPSGTCATSGSCGNYFVVEGDGGIDPWDFYVLDEWKLGSVADTSFTALRDAPLTRQFFAHAAPRLREIAEAEKERCRDNRKRPTSGRRRSFLRLIIVQKFAKARGKKLSVQSAEVAGGHALRLAEHPVEAADRAEAALLGHLRDG